MATSGTYDVDSRSKANRYAKKATYDREAIQAVVKATPLVHVSFNAPPGDGLPQFPTILPMLGAMGTFSDDDEPHVYLHGSSASRLVRLTTGHEENGLPVCISASVLDGFVLALTPYNHSVNYRSAVMFGYATRLTDDAEIQYAMELITNTMTPDRYQNTRLPSKAEVTATGILKVRIETASAKIRTGPSVDDKKDLRNEDVISKTWIGVVPAYQVLGAPVPDEHNRVAKAPVYLEKWIDESNVEKKEYAVTAIQKA